MKATLKTLGQKMIAISQGGMTKARAARLIGVSLFWTFPMTRTATACSMIYRVAEFWQYPNRLPTLLYVFFEEFLEFLSTFEGRSDPLNAVLIGA